MAGERTLGRYRLLGRLGRGGMGEVHLATYEGAAGFEKTVAVKVLQDAGAESPDRTRALLREALLGVHLEHPNVVEILDLGDAEGTYFIAMEYVRGYTLAHLTDFQRTHGEALPIRIATEIARQVAAAVHYVHTARDRAGRALLLAHGDISPSNVLIGCDGRIKLSDFGLSVLAHEPQPNRLAGKVAYLPPEAFEGEPRARDWDVYALGALVYELVTGYPPYLGQGGAAVRAAMAAGLTPIRERRSDCPPALARLAERAISPRADERYRSAEALQHALDDAVPRRVDDADRLRETVAELFRRPAFVADYGELPSGGAYAPEAELAPFTDHTAASITAGVSLRREAPLKFGLSPAVSAPLAREYAERLASLLSARLGRNVRPIVYGDYRTLATCVAAGEVDLAWMPPQAFLMAAEAGAGGLATIQRHGQTAYESAIIVRADSDVQTLQDLRGARVAWVDRDSASGYLFAAATMTAALGDLDDALDGQDFHGSHKAICHAVLRRWATAGATYANRDAGGEVVSSAWHEFFADEADQFRALAFTAPIPGDTLAHRPFLPAAQAAELRAVLFSLGDDDEGRATLRQVFNASALAPVELDLYERVRDVLRRG